MATILVKKGAGTPSPDSLQEAELALDIVDGSLYSKLNDGEIHKLNSGGGGGEFVHIGANPPASPEEGQQWMEVPASGDATMWIYDGGKWLQQPGGKDGADGNIADATEQGVIATWDDTAKQWTPEGDVRVQDGRMAFGFAGYPQSIVHISSGSYPSLRLSSDDGSTNLNFSHTKSTGTSDISATGALMFNTSGSERLRIDSSGNVGIGTQSPGADLHVAGNTSGVIARFHDGVAANLYIEGNSSILRLANRAANGQLGFTVNNGSSDALRINASEQVYAGTPLHQSGLGTLSACGTSPVFAFKNNTVASDGHIIGSIKAYSTESSDRKFDNRRGAEINFVAVGNSNAYQQPTAITFATNSSPSSDVTTERMKIGHDGRVDITGSLYVNGTPKIGTAELIETLHTLREATKDETTIKGLRDAIGNAVGGLIEKFEAMQSTATQEISDE